MLMEVRAINTHLECRVNFVVFVLREENLFKIIISDALERRNPPLVGRRIVAEVGESLTGQHLDLIVP